MKALLDEQLSPQIAVLLREAGYDAVAVAERVDLVGSIDSTILEVATGEGRAVVTNNIKDFRPLAAERLAQGRTHGGLILVPSTRTRSSRCRHHARGGDREGAARPSRRADRQRALDRAAPEWVTQRGFGLTAPTARLI